jgi:hypothetical protein
LPFSSAHLDNLKKKENCTIEAIEHSQEVLNNAIPKFNLMSALISEPEKDKNRHPGHTYIYIKNSHLIPTNQKRNFLPHTNKS